MNQRFQVETITPDRAAAYLSKNDLNRPVSPGWVVALAAAMARGEWKVNGEAIKFAKSGRLMDGQHRLHAILKAGIPQPMVVARDLDEDTFDTLDQGKKRTSADVLSMRGEKNAPALASAARAMIAIRRGGNFAGYCSAIEIENILDTHPDLRRWVDAYAGSKAKTFMTSLFPAVLTLGARKHDEEVAEVFLQQVATGANLAPKSPALSLRERMIESHTSGSKRLKTPAIAAITIKAWNAFAHGKQVGVLRYSPDEIFPTVR